MQTKGVKIHKREHMKVEYLDFSEGYEKTLLKLGIQTEDTSRTLKVAVGGG